MLWVLTPAGDLHVKRTAVHSSSRFCLAPSFSTARFVPLSLWVSSQGERHLFLSWFHNSWHLKYDAACRYPRSNVSGGALSGAGAESRVGCDSVLESLWRLFPHFINIFGLCDYLTMIRVLLWFLISILETLFFIFDAWNLRAVADDGFWCLPA